MSKILNSNKFLHRLLGRYRLLFGFCPRCGFDPPANTERCHVCTSYDVSSPWSSYYDAREGRGPYPPTKKTKKLWWFSWVRPRPSKSYDEYCD